MRTNKNSQKALQDGNKLEPLLNAKNPNVFAKVGRPFKMLFYATSLVGIGLLFNSCMAGYIATEPAYVEFDRPPRPSEGYIWINGDWAWNRQTHVYVQNAGYWEKPRQGRTYVSGHWQSSPKGKYWTKGHWQSNGRQKDKPNR
jgi:hypothetical protein